MFNKKKPVEKVPTTPKFLGRKTYAIAAYRHGADMICANLDREHAISNMDGAFPILVELTVTKVFKKSSQVEQIEGEITDN